MPSFASFAFQLAGLPPFFRRLILGLNRRQKVIGSLGDCSFQQLRGQLKDWSVFWQKRVLETDGTAYSVSLIIVTHLFNARVNQRLQSILVTANYEFFPSIQGRGWEKNKFRKCEEAVFFRKSGSCYRFTYLTGDDLWRIKHVDLTVHSCLAGR